MQAKNKPAPTAAERAHIERRPVVGFEGLYEVDSNGDIYSLDRVLPHPICKERLLKGKKLKKATGSTGYQHLSMFLVGGKRVIKNVHRVVCEAFHGPSLGLVVNHKNGDRQDNRASNLEWVSQSYNNWHSFAVLGRKPPRNTLGKFGHLHHNSIPIEAVSANGEVVATYAAMHEAQRAGYSASGICAVVNGRVKTHMGLVWRRKQ